MRNKKGFTTFELVVVVAVVAILALVALPKFYHLTQRAEALNVQGMIGQMRGALSMQMARGLYRGDNLAAWAYNGSKPLYPMRDLLLKPPKSYLGVLTGSNKRGHWYDDKNSHELVYVVRNSEIVSGISGEPKKLRWRIEVAYENHTAKKTLLGLLLQPSTPHQWLFE